VDVAVPRSRFDKIHNLADMLGIPVSKLKKPEDFLLDPNEPRLAASQVVTRAKQQKTKETPPLCCWHCNKTFPQLKEFQRHLESQHKGETYKTKRHKCTKCKKIFPTMWKLRTHLLTHSSPKKLSKRGDHEYAEEPSKKTLVQSVRKTVSDHPYANPADSTPAPATVQDETRRLEETSNGQARAADRVNSEHSYGTRQRLASIREGDHAYSSKMPDINDQIVARHDENDGNNENNGNNGNNRNNENNGNDENNANNENAGNNGNNETTENIELVQLLSVIRNEQPPPGSSIIAQVPEQTIKPKGSAKRKPTIKARKILDPLSSPKKQETVSLIDISKILGSKFNCDFCDRVFPQAYRLSRHVLEVHKKEKRHRCQICEKSFFKLSSKKRHELTHVTHDTWKCSSCMKIFKDSSSLKYHVRKKVCTKKTKLSQKSSIVLE